MSYVIQYARGKRITIAPVDVMTPNQAREQAITILAKHHKGIDPKQKKTNSKIATLELFIEEQYKPWAKINAASQINTANQVIKHFKKYTKTPLDKFTTEQIEKWRSNVLEKNILAPASTNRILNCLKSIFSLALNYEILKINPLENLKLINIEAKHIRYLSKPETNQLYQTLTKRDQIAPEQNYKDALTPMMILSLNTGGRLAEIRTTEIKNINLSEKYIFFPKTKTHNSRYVPLNQVCITAIKNWLKDIDKIDSPYLFPGRDDQNKPINNMTKSFKTLLKNAKIENFTWHDMRHDFASKLAMANVSLYVIQKLLGHKSIRTTERYAHLAHDILKESVEKIENSAKPHRDELDALEAIDPDHL